MDNNLKIKNNMNQFAFKMKLKPGMKAEYKKDMMKYGLK